MEPEDFVFILVNSWNVLPSVDATKKSIDITDRKTAEMIV